MKSWQVKNLGAEELFSIGTGGTPSTSEPQYWNGDIPWVTPTDLSNLGTAVITETARTITPQGAANSSAKPLPVGTVVISTRAPIGYATILGKEMAINQGCKAVVIKDHSQVSSEYLYYNVLTQTQKMQELGSGSTFRELSQHNLKSIEIPLPPKSEQEKIAHILNTIQESIKIQNEIVDKTKELKASLMQKLFTEGTKGEKLKNSEIGKIPESWETAYLGDICKPRKEQVIPEVDDLYIGLEHIDSGDVNLSRRGTGQEVRSLKNRFYPSDILYGKLRPYLDKAVIADLEGVCSTDILVLNIFASINSVYLVNILHTNRFLSYAIDNTSGTNHPRTSWDAVRKFQIPHPSLPEQQNIADFLSAVDQKIELEQKKRDLYQELFEAMLDKLMLGEIRVDKLNFN